MSKDRAVLIAGTASGGNSTSTTGPAMATTRPSFKVGVLSVTVMSDLQDQRVVVLAAVAGAAMAAGEVEDVEGLVGQEVGFGRLAGAERLGATDDLHDLGGDGVLPGPVHDPAQLGDQLVGVVGGRLHR